MHPLYSAAELAETWSGEFHGFGNQCEWPRYDGPTIIPDHNRIKKGRRKHNRANMIMDEMEGRTMGHQARRSTSDKRATGLLIFGSFANIWCHSYLKIYLHKIFGFILIYIEASSSRTTRQQSRRSTSDIYTAGLLLFFYILIFLIYKPYILIRTFIFRNICRLR